MQLDPARGNERAAMRQLFAVVRSADARRNRLRLMSPVGKIAGPLDWPLKDSAKGLILRLNLTDRRPTYKDTSASDYLAPVTLYQHTALSIWGALLRKHPQTAEQSYISAQ
jgi:hypothetical protein